MHYFLYIVSNMEVCITIFGIHFQCSCSEFALLQIESFIIRLAALWQLSNKSLYSSPPAFTKSDTDPSKLFLFFKLKKSLGKAKMIRVHQVLNIFMSWIYHFIYKHIFKKTLMYSHQ